jgi:hypothetical protein
LNPSMELIYEDSPLAEDLEGTPEPVVAAILYPSIHPLVAATHAHCARPNVSPGRAAPNGRVASL